MAVALKIGLSHSAKVCFIEYTVYKPSKGSTMLFSARNLLAVASLAVLSASASAQNIQGFYIGGGLGVSDVNDTKGSFAGQKVEQDWQLGGIGVLSLGYGFGNGLRAEIEGSYRGYESDTAKIGGRAATSSGRSSAYAIFANVLYDLDLRLLGLDTQAVVPYFGGGVGYASWSWDNVRASSAGTTVTIDDSDGLVAFQAIAGLSFPIASVPGLSVSAEYRYYNESGDPELRATGTSGGVSRSSTIKIGNSNHNFLIGLRYAFNTAPVVAAAAPVAAARTFLVFFDWSKADLTDRARQIIGEAATARGAGVTRIEVNGFTDRSGPADYNMQLSIRRANAVAAELVRRGVPRNEIVTRGFGEENNLVPTADGVREPQNRRVEIILK
jgi:outer membrane protein OmpA-like peptidoglycan-associated protein